jgi:hypothetical protein
MKNWSPIKWIVVIGAVVLVFFFAKGFAKGFASSRSSSGPFETPDDFYYFLGF